MMSGNNSSTELSRIESLGRSARSQGMVDEKSRIAAKSAWARALPQRLRAFLENCLDLPPRVKHRPVCIRLGANPMKTPTKLQSRYVMSYQPIDDSGGVGYRERIRSR